MTMGSLCTFLQHIIDVIDYNVSFALLRIFFQGYMGKMSLYITKISFNLNRYNPFKFMK